MAGKRAALFRGLNAEGWVRDTWIHAILSPIVVTIGLAAMIFDTAAEAGSQEDVWLSAAVSAAWVLLVVELAVRIWVAPEGRDLDNDSPLRARLRLLASPLGMIDIAAALALPLGWLLGLDHRDGQLLAIVWALKYIRHSTGLLLLVRVAVRARAALFSVMTVFFVVFLGAATVAYVFERQAQPVLFGSVPRAMWWAIVTLTTTGYGDVVPQTVWGRLLGGWVMVSGIAVFALWAGIIANAFSEELRRRDFLRTWDLVAQVPFFQHLGAAAIADIVRLLQSRDVAAGTILFRRGQPGDTMYFIVSGEVIVETKPNPHCLAAGEFVGEMALLFGSPRSATVTATKPSLLLALDIANFRELAGRRPELINTIEAEAKRRQEMNLTSVG